MNILMLEDDPAIAQGLRYSLESEGYTVTHCATVARALEAVGAGRFDLCLLDLTLPDGSGYDVCKAIKAKDDTPVIFLTAFDDEVNVVMGLELGAEDYITKPFGVRELQARVQAALRRLPASVEKLCVGALTLLPATREAYVDGNRVDLTQKEFELLLDLARHADSTVTRAMLVRDIWGYATEEDNSRTVDSHIKTLRLKLGDAAGEPRFIQTVRGTGYRLMRGDQP